MRQPDLFKTGPQIVHAAIPERSRSFWAVVDGWGRLNIRVTAGKETPGAGRLLCGPYDDRSEAETEGAAELAGEA